MFTNMRIFIDSLIDDDINATLNSKLFNNKPTDVTSLEVKHTFNIKKLKDVDLNIYPNITELILHNNYGYNDWIDIKDGLIKFSHITKLTMYNFVIFRGLVFKNYTKLKMLELKIAYIAVL